jgi:ACT domain-containing protein
MATDLTVELTNRPGTLAEAMAALGRAGVNIGGACDPTGERMRGSSSNRTTDEREVMSP